MAKSKSLKTRAKNFVRSSGKTAEKALPVINNNLKNAGVLAKDVAKETIPVVEKGVSAVYGTMATGFNLGIKGAKNVSKVASKMRKSSKRSKKSARKTRRKY
jgi:hypothetical protein